LSGPAQKSVLDGVLLTKEKQMISKLKLNQILTLVRENIFFTKKVNFFGVENE